MRGSVREEIGKEGAGRREGEEMLFGIGIHVGDVIVEGTNLFADARTPAFTLLKRLARGLKMQLWVKLGGAVDD
jgi:hypothetical protein